jgi:hypothetical protein
MRQINLREADVEKLRSLGERLGVFLSYGPHTHDHSISRHLVEHHSSGGITTTAIEIDTWFVELLETIVEWIEALV